MPNSLDLFMKNLRAAMATDRVGQNELGKKSEMSSPQVNRYFTGKATPGFNVMSRWAEALGRPLYWFFQDHDAPIPADAESALQLVQIELDRIRKTLELQLGSPEQELTGHFRQAKLSDIKLELAREIIALNDDQAARFLKEIRGTLKASQAPLQSPETPQPVKKAKNAR